MSFGAQNILDHLEEGSLGLYLILLTPGHLTLSQSNETRGKGAYYVHDALKTGEGQMTPGTLQGQSDSGLVWIEKNSKWAAKETIRPLCHIR